MAERMEAKPFDGFTKSSAWDGARSCPYCARFSEDGHAESCPWGAHTNLYEAAEATLMFHGAPRWTEEQQARWLELTGVAECTTKVLCDFVRAALSRARGEV